MEAMVFQSTLSMPLSQFKVSDGMFGGTENEMAG